MSIRAVLFDAEGVLQRPHAERRDRFGEVLGPGKDLDAFMVALFTAEYPALAGEREFATALEHVLSSWECVGTFEDAVFAWTMMVADEGVARLIREVRSAGVPCHLATNQETIRARHMSEVMGYGKLFDRQFYSCEMGLKKPDAEYFRAILSSIEMPAEDVLFIDDRKENVTGARSVGLEAEVFDLVNGPEELRDLLTRHRLVDPPEQLRRRPVQ